MRIGLYGLPTAGKSFILGKVKTIEVLSGSALLREVCPEFHSLEAEKKASVRKALAARLLGRDHFMMDGHYAFGNEVVFTEEDGRLYDAFLYLYVRPDILKKRMEASERNRRYLRYDIGLWQDFEVCALRQYCMEHRKDFYVLDEPEEGYFSDINPVLQFIECIVGGFSCIRYAGGCVKQIRHDYPGSRIVITDGDGTLSREDSSRLLGYQTHIFDGNFYTGFQSWRHARAFSDYMRDRKIEDLDEMGLTFRAEVMSQIKKPAVILSSGAYEIWRQAAKRFGMSVYCGEMMAAETKYFVVKFLQEAGFYVTAYGDSMNDYFMLKQADEAYLVRKPNGAISSSLKNRDLEGIRIV